MFLAELRHIYSRQRIKAWHKDPVLAPLHYEYLQYSAVGDDGYDTRYTHYTTQHFPTVAGSDGVLPVYYPFHHRGSEE